MHEAHRSRVPLTGRDNHQCALACPLIYKAYVAVKAGKLCCKGLRIQSYW